MKRSLFGGLAMVAMCLCGGQASAQNKVFEVAPLFSQLQKGDKGAILITHFGTTHNDTRAVTLDAINKQIAQSFPELEVREAYTSRIVIKRLADNKEIYKLNPTEALEQLHRDGYTHILILPTSLTDGVEMASVNREAQCFKDSFKEVRVATPILFHEKDYENLVNVMLKESQPDAATIWVGHGTYDVATAQYAMLDHLLLLSGQKNTIVGCVEGYPYFDQALTRLKETGLKKVVLRPLMIVAGEHAKEDIAGDWQEQFSAMGFEVETKIVGLGELPAIQQLLVDKAKFYMNNRRVPIGEKKKIYEVTGEKLHADE